MGGGLTAMPGETDLDILLAAMAPRLQPETYVFVTIAPGTVEPAGLTPLMRFAEAEGTTLIIEHAAALAAGLEGTFPCRMITLDIHSSLAAVGFLAATLPRLAAAGIGVNPVSGYFHDHLFVPADRAADAVAILTEMARNAAK